MNYNKDPLKILKSSCLLNFYSAVEDTKIYNFIKESY
jgi:hypothetical protein